MELTKNFKMLNGFGQKVLLECLTGKYYRIYDENLGSKLDEFFYYDIDDREIVLKLEKIKTNVSEANQEIKVLKAEKFYINRLAMVLTSSCNLRCKYCYANYGMYDYKKQKRMTKETINKAIKYFTQNFKGIRSIQFFGGEPSLCTDLIKYTVEKFEEYKSVGKVESMPTFAIVTNAFNLNDELIKLIKKYKISVTISVDGPKEINDKVRIDMENKGSFNNIYMNYTKMNKIGINKIDIECTYTQEHLKRNISLVDLVKYFSENFNSNTPHIVPVCIERNHYLSVENDEEKFKKYVEELIDYTFYQLMEKKRIKTISIVLGTLNNILNANFKKEICPAGIGTFSISHDEKISPCFMYTSTENLAYGEIGEESDLILDKAYKFNEKFNNKLKVNKCIDCFAQSFCSSCLGNFKINKNRVEQESNVYCNMIKIIAKNILLKISEIKSDTKKWNQFLMLVQGEPCE